MKVEYDGETDTLTVILRQGVVAESDEDKPGIILDYDGNQNDDTEPRPSQVLLQLEVLISRDENFEPGIRGALKELAVLQTSHPCSCTVRT